MNDFPRPRRVDETELRSSAGYRTIAVIDDQRTFADLLVMALSREPDLDCVGAAYRLDEGLALVMQRRPDVVVLDVQFEGDDRDGVVAAAAITAAHPQTRVVLLTARADADLMRRAADAGVCSLLLKDGSLPELLRAVRTARPGGLVVHPTLLRSLITEERTRTPIPSLSRREKDVLSMMLTGMDARGIAGHLGISVNTCRGYVKSLMRKLNAHSQLEAVAIARRHGLAILERPA